MSGKKRPDALETNAIYCMDVREGLKKMSDESVDCVVTSPPYWVTRDYSLEPVLWGGDPKCRHDFAEVPARLAHENRQNLVGGTIGNLKYRHGLHGHGTSKAGVCRKCGAWRGSLGLESDFNLYIEHLCNVFDEVLRILKKTGTLWVNLGDTYAGSCGGYTVAGVTKGAGDDGSASTSWRRSACEQFNSKPPSSLPQHVKPRSLCQIPARFAIAMCERGWILRNDIVWHKPNHMPASVKNRFACSWEHMFLFAKQPKYYFDLDAVRVPHKHLETRNQTNDGKEAVGLTLSAGPHLYERQIARSDLLSGSEKRNALRVLKLVRRDQHDHKVPGFRMVMRGHKQAAYGHAGVRPTRSLELRDHGFYILKSHPNGKNPGDCWDIATRSFKEAHFAVYPEQLCQRPILAGCPVKVCKRCGTPRPSETAHGARRKSVDRGENALGCKCKAGWQPGVVLDPFLGSGTTAVVAKRLGRHFIGFEQSTSYAAMARRRLASTATGPDPPTRTSAPRAFSEARPGAHAA